MSEGQWLTGNLLKEIKFPACARSEFRVGLYPLAAVRRIVAARLAGPAVVVFDGGGGRSGTGSRRRARARDITIRALAGCATCASRLCGAVCGNGRSPRGMLAAPRISAARRRRRATAQQRATNTTLAATRRHPCRPRMVAADCAWFRSRPESVVAPGGTERSAENAPR